MRKLKIAVLPGDGIGQDVTRAAVPIFDALQLPIEIIFGDIGWECWKNEANPIPQRTWDLINSCDAVLLGATTSLPEKEAIEALPHHLQQTAPQYISPIVQLRQKLDLYANIRPCYQIKENQAPFHFVVIRENTEGLYAGLDYYPIPDKLCSIINENNRWSQVKPNQSSCTIRLQTEMGLKRLFDYAFQYAQDKHFRRVTFADKPNVLRKSSVFARKLFEESAKHFPQIQADIHNVDAVALWMVRRPDEFGVIVAENMFGDILSDLGAGVMGGLGFAASANIGNKGNYFEPVHGSAPRILPNKANPSAMFLTISLLLEHFAYETQAQQIRNAVQAIIHSGKYVTYDLGGTATTKEMAEKIIEQATLSEKMGSY